MTQLQLRADAAYARAFIRATLTAPTSSCQVDLDGIGEPHERGAAVYLQIDAERKAGWHLVTKLDPEEPVRVVHAISRWSGGEIRGWVWARGRMFLRHPATPAEWPELDQLVTEALGATSQEPRTHTVEPFPPRDGCAAPRCSRCGGCGDGSGSCACPCGPCATCNARSS